MAQITYNDKSNYQSSSLANEYKVTSNDINEIKNVINANTPIGTIQMYAGNTAPTGWLICDGSAISRTTYANLFSVIGTTYGNGNGTTTFNIPNLQGKIPVGLDANDSAFDTIGETGGEKTHTLTIDEMPSHDHSTGGSYLGNGSGNTTATWLSWNAGSAKVQATGGDQAHNNLQPYIVLNYIISY